MPVNNHDHDENNEEQDLGPSTSSKRNRRESALTLGPRKKPYVINCLT